MGDWSEVAIKCKPKAYKMFEMFLGKEIFPDKIYRHINNIHILHWELGRWDEDDEEVQRITELMDKHDELGDEFGNQDGYGYDFLRLGEGDGDIETRDNTDELRLYISRCIYISDSFEEVETK